MLTSCPSSWCGSRSALRVPGEPCSVVLLHITLQLGQGGDPGLHPGNMVGILLLPVFQNSWKKRVENISNLVLLPVCVELSSIIHLLDVRCRGRGYHHPSKSGNRLAGSIGYWTFEAEKKRLTSHLMAERWLKKSLLRLFSLNACNWKCTFLAIGFWNVSGHLDFRYFVWSGLQQFLHKLIIWLPFVRNILSKIALPYWNLYCLFNEWKFYFGNEKRKK